MISVGRGVSQRAASNVARLPGHVSVTVVMSVRAALSGKAG
jgi:hypothetical protein